MQSFRGPWFLLAALVATPSFAQPGTGTLRVAPTGTNSGTCGSVATPCQAVQQAVQLAVTGDQVLVAGGTYTYAAAVTNPCTSSLGAQAVLCVVNKDLTVRGGFSTADWVTPNPGINPTILDGQSARRVIQVIQTASNQPAAGLTLTDFTVRNGRVVGAGSGTDAATFAFGGGLLSDASRLLIQRVEFSDNVALGGSTSTVYGGSGAGGGAAVRAALAGTRFEDVTFANNLAQGGTGPTRGGFAVGGGLFVYDSELEGVRLLFTNNDAVGGNTAGSGTDGSGFQGDALGGGAAFQVGSHVILRGVTATGNEAIGGDAGTAAGNTAAGAFGGGLYAEGSSAPGFDTSLSLVDALLVNNTARGGIARNGGLGAGGGLMTIDTTLDVARVQAHSNDALGGNGSGGSSGAAGGGGLYLVDFGAAQTVAISHSVIADNVATQGAGTPTGGGGGGLFLQGIQGTFDHLTLDRNSLGAAGMQGSGLVALAGTAGCNFQLRWSAVTGHTVPGTAKAVHVQSGNTVTFTAGLFSGNSDDSNEGDAGAGTFVNSGAITSVADLLYAAPGGPSWDYHLQAGSPAIDAATGSSANLDFEAQPRSLPDIGADEFLDGLIFADGFETGDTSRWH